MCLCEVCFTLQFSFIRRRYESNLSHYAVAAAVLLQHGIFLWEDLFYVHILSAVMRETGDAFERGESHATRRGCTRKHTRAFWETSEAYSGAREMRDGGLPRRLTYC